MTNSFQHVELSQTDFPHNLEHKTDAHGLLQGLDSGDIDDETYAVYDKPWRNQDNVTQYIYRPGKNLDKNIYGDDLDKIIKTNRFVLDKGFSGADPNAKRDGPVQFERSEEDNPFGLGQLLKSAKEGMKRGGGGDDRQESSSSSRCSRK
uniref:Uncharacterized protein n=1 Tax=Plectus sambesii TaxID=2011161 RepID=A0A914W402_9BILA